MNNMWHNYNWTAVNFRALTVSIYQGHIWWISCLRGKHLQKCKMQKFTNAPSHLISKHLQHEKVHRMFFSALRERSNSDWMFQSVRFANIYIFFGISMKLTFLMQATRLDRKHRKICEYCPGHSLIVQSLTLYVMLRHSGRWAAYNWRPKISFSLFWKVLMKPGFVCHTNWTRKTLS